MVNDICCLKMVPLYCIVVLLLNLWLYDEYKERFNDKLSVQLAVPSFPSKTRVKESKTSKKLGTVHKKLSINLVIVPFLNYSKDSSHKGATGYIIKRKQEYRTAIQRNLNHPLVNRVHVLTTDPQETMRHFNNFTNQEKMLPK